MGNRIALITGANKGLGFETSRQLAKSGYTVIMASRNKKLGEEAVAKLKGEGLDVSFLEIDMNTPSTFVAARDYIAKTYQKLDCLVNNAGITGGENLFSNTTLSLPINTLKEIYQTNFFGVVELTQTLLPLLEKSDNGYIINLSSVLGSLTEHANPASGIAAAKALGYNSSKTALNAFGLHLADALKGKKIVVYSAHPGWVKTDLGTNAAPLSVNEGVKTVVELATGQVTLPSGSYVHLGKTLPW